MLTPQNALICKQRFLRTFCVLSAILFWSVGFLHLHAATTGPVVVPLSSMEVEEVSESNTKVESGLRFGKQVVPPVVSSRASEINGRVVAMKTAEKGPVVIDISDAGKETKKSDRNDLALQLEVTTEEAGETAEGVEEVLEEVEEGADEEDGVVEEIEEEEEDEEESEEEGEEEIILLGEISKEVGEATEVTDEAVEMSLEEEQVIEEIEEQDETALQMELEEDIEAGTVPKETTRETKPKLLEKIVLDPNKVGNPNSATLVRMMYDEVMNGLAQRGMSEKYNMFRSYARSTLDKFASLNTGNEVDGRCRLSWYDRMYRDPIKSVFEVEEFTRKLHDGLSGNHRYLGETLKVIRDKLDIPVRNDELHYSRATTPLEAVAEVKRCIMEAQAGYARAISTLTQAEQRELATTLYPTFVANRVSGHTIPSRSVGRRLVLLLDKMDRTGIHEGLEALLPLSDKSLLDLLAQLPDDAFPHVQVGSQRMQRIATPAGDILIGGRENNVYELDAPGMQDVTCVIDLGGNDIYREGTCNINRPVFVTVDLGGDDRYVATKPGVQGGSILGISMLISRGGNDVFQAQDIAQGATLGGAGMLINESGNDSYSALRFAQGSALGGVGLLIDHNGHDQYRAALLAQGVGQPGGFGALEDTNGNDKYYVGGLYLDSYPEHPGYDGWGQGLGAGIRQVANGGIGALLDGAGDDTYEFDYFAHGGGYWLGLGFARDFGGNDKRMGATLLDYYGNARKEGRWQRFCNGFGCHYSLGFLIDDEGDDVYDGTIMGTGMAWDLSIGFLLDFAGKDRYAATGNMTQGIGAEGSIGILFDYGGSDTYMSRNPGYANPGITYHSPSNCGSNFSFLIDYGGKNEFAAKLPNTGFQQRGSSGGYFISRPFDFEYEEEQVAAKKAAEEAAKQPQAQPTPNTKRPQRGQQQQQQQNLSNQPTRSTVTPVPTLKGTKR
ncbi:MAG: hypothetical protein ACRC10_07650 [Thermoguttaceae bacterium]